MKAALLLALAALGLAFFLELYGGVVTLFSVLLLVAAELR